MNKNVQPGYDVFVNDEKFESAYSAAKYIVEQEAMRSNKLILHSTVSKEIRRIITGKRSGSTLYRRYKISPSLS
jgi:hypothetical protein